MAEAAGPKIRGALLAAGALVMAVAGLFVYGPALRGTWLWDDDYEITHDSLIKTWDGWWRIWTGEKIPDYFPIKTDLQWVQWHLWGETPFGYHLVNLGFHVLAAFLLWRVLARLAGEAAGFWAGLLFVVHPMAVESVAWISELKNGMSLVAVLLALGAWIDWEERKPGGFRYGTSLVWFAVAMLCKSSVVMFPVVLLLYAWWRRGRVGWGDVRASLPFFGISVALGLVTVWFQANRAIAGEDLHLGGWLWRLGSAGMAIAFYFFKSVVPVGWMPIYPDWGKMPLWIEPLLCWGGIVAALAFLWSRRRGWGRDALFGIGFFLINVLPVLGFVPMSYLRISRVADHLCYLPLVGIVALAGVAVAKAGEAREWPTAGRPYRVVIGAVGCIFLALVSRGQAGNFTDPLTFWTYAAKRNPGSWLAQNDLGNALYEAGHSAEATACYQRAVRIMPHYAEAQNNLGNMMLNAGLIGEAMKHYDAALKILPNYATPQNGIGLAYLRTGHPAEAAERFRLALKVLDGFPEAHYNLGLALSRIHQLPQAVAEYREALRTKPVYPMALSDLGNALWAMGSRAEAISAYRTALEQDPGYAEAHYNFGLALRESGDVSGAAVQFAATVKLRPQFAPAYRNLALLLRALGREGEAEQVWAAAQRLSAKK